MKSEENANVKQNRRKLNAIDIVIIVIAICGILAVVFFALMMLRGDPEESSQGTKKENAGETFEYIIKLPKLNTELYSITKGADNVAGCPSLQVGDAVYERESGKYIGKITSILYEEHVEPTNKYDASGRLIYANYVGYVDLLITVEAASNGKDGALAINGYNVRAGAELSFRTYGFYGDGKITHVGEKTSNNEEGGE